MLTRQLKSAAYAPAVFYFTRTKSLRWCLCRLTHTRVLLTWLIWKSNDCWKLDDNPIIPMIPIVKPWSRSSWSSASDGMANFSWLTDTLWLFNIAVENGRCTHDLWWFIYLFKKKKTTVQLYLNLCCSRNSTSPSHKLMKAETHESRLNGNHGFSIAFCYV